MAKISQEMQPLCNNDETAECGLLHARSANTENNLTGKLWWNVFTKILHLCRLHRQGNDRVWWKNIFGRILRCFSVSESTATPQIPNCQIIHGKWKLGNRLGAGGFGKVYEAEDLRTGRQVAVKIETISSRRNTLKNESQVYNVLRQKRDNVIGFPECIYFGKISGCRQCLVLQKLGRSLWSFMLHGQISNRTAFIAGIQGLHRLEDLHQTGYIHGDVKPENFVIGADDPEILYLIDFGLSMRYLNDDGRHAPAKPTTRLIGTVEYTSIDSHRGMPQTRRSDLESFGYVILELLEGCLPWTGISGSNYIRRVMEAKKQFRYCTKMRTGVGAELTQYFEYIRGLKFDEKPCYSYLRGLFRMVMERL